MGIATQMFMFIQKFARQRGMHKLWADTRTNNKPAIAMVKSAGYRKVAKLRRHWYG